MPTYKHIAVAVLLLLLAPLHAFAHSAMDRFWGEVPVDMRVSGDVLITKTLVVPEDVTLTIEPGTIVRFEGSKSGGNRILVKGRLAASGTGDRPIKFVPRDSGSGPWFGIEFAPGATGGLAHCVVEGSTDGVVFEGPGVTVEDVEVR